MHGMCSVHGDGVVVAAPGLRATGGSQMADGEGRGFKNWNVGLASQELRIDPSWDLCVCIVRLYYFPRPASDDEDGSVAISRVDAPRRLRPYTGRTERRTRPPPPPPWCVCDCYVVLYVAVMAGALEATTTPSGANP